MKFLPLYFDHPLFSSSLSFFFRGGGKEGVEYAPVYTKHWNVPKKVLTVIYNGFFSLDDGNVILSGYVAVFLTADQALPSGSKRPFIAINGLQTVKAYTYTFTHTFKFIVLNFYFNQIWRKKLSLSDQTNFSNIRLIEKKTSNTNKISQICW